jgi:hypothetical protein
VDFTGLNKAYPKDSFLLPRIDLLMDLNIRTSTLELYGCLLGVQSDPHG